MRVRSQGKEEGKFELRSVGDLWAAKSPYRYQAEKQEEY